jgi:hypothetical protein
MALVWENPGAGDMRQPYFGGLERDRLFITAGKSLYAIDLNTVVCNSLDGAINYDILMDL